MADNPKLRDDQQLLDLEPLAENNAGISGAGFAGSVTRRTFISGLGAAGLVAGAAPLTFAEPAPARAAATDGAATMVTINGKSDTSLQASIPASPFSTWSASASSSPAPKKAATMASAAPAPSTWMAAASTPA